MARIFLGQDFRVCGQDFLHFVIRQGRQQSKTSGPNTQWVPVSRMKRMDSDRVGAFLAMDADGVHAPWDREKSRVARLLAQPQERAERNRMYAEASARDVAKNINLRSDIVAPCFRILIEKAC